MTSRIAIVGMACQYPDASTPAQLWENILTQRRSFRRFPAQRVNLQDYFSQNRETPDCTYSNQAALIEGYEFDRTRFQVAGSTFRSTDMAHWLALDVANRALIDAGFLERKDLPRNTTRVIVGNTLTGESSRANSLRLRWPYVRRTAQATLDGMGFKENIVDNVLEEFERKFKSPFPALTEESLAGGLSNTIAGRICNHFDLKGGGYSIDGACASSLLAVVEACAALSAKDADVVIAGGVDVSLDPFELVGFAKAGALASALMRVFDTDSDGFLPGEGCGFLVLMRSFDARRRGIRAHATIRGWGISSDGKGGITRPVKEGQILALKRAYARAGFSPNTVQYFEAHGTGTAVGDEVELHALGQVLEEAGGLTCPVIGSVKTNIGHTKAAAGVAGLLKAIMTVKAGLIPPTVGCIKPSPKLKASQLRVTNSLEPWPKDKPLRAGVSAMGFGGINSHIVVEGRAAKSRGRLSKDENILNQTPQDAELFALGANSSLELTSKIRRLRQYAHSLAFSELADLAAELAGTFSGVARGAVVAGSPDELEDALIRLETLASRSNSQPVVDTVNMVFLGLGHFEPRIGFLFPGQGTEGQPNSVLYRRRFPQLRHYLDRVLSNDLKNMPTQIAQPTIVGMSLAGLYLLRRFGVRAGVSLGHSLGELVALHWAGAFDEQALFRIAELRGNSMAACAGAGGMVAVGSGEDTVSTIILGTPVVLACSNAPSQVVVSGPVESLQSACQRMKEAGLQVHFLKVSHAFHSPMMESAKQALGNQLLKERLRPVQKKIVSTITGRLVAADDDLRQMLVEQLTKPVRFKDALFSLGREVGLLIEVGPGSVLSSLARQCIDVPAISVDCGGETLRGFLGALGAAAALGARIRIKRLFDDRSLRPFSLDWKPKFFVNPCESTAEVGVLHLSDAGPRESDSLAVVRSTPSLEIMREVVARRCELPLKSISADSRFLDDLHLNSLAVSELIVESARRLGVEPPPMATEYSNATILEALEALESRPPITEIPGGSSLPSGVDHWVRNFSFDLRPDPLKQKTLVRPSGDWKVFSGRSSLSSNGLSKLLSREVGGKGVVAVLPTYSEEQCLNVLLRATDHVLEDPNASYIIVQSGLRTAGFARSLHSEFPDTPICVIGVDERTKHIEKILVEEARRCVGFSEVYYDAGGIRFKPSIRLIPTKKNSYPDTGLHAGDVLLVTGGGKGIGAECALALAQLSGCSVGLVGRGEIDRDEIIMQNRRRFEAAGARCQYVSADVSNRNQLRGALSEIQATLGTVTAVLHAAGVNEPMRLRDLKREDFSSALAPKVAGLRNLLTILNPEKLRLVVAFGSIIARTGMQGEAHYALANEWLAKTLEVFGNEHRGCKCLLLEWSVWSGVGMGDRLGVLETMRSKGIEPITIDSGINAIRALVSHPPDETRIVVASRFGGYRAFGLDEPELPLLRFLEFPRLYYPAIELVTECELSRSADPYLDDHIVGNERIFPAVMVLEAAIQIASTLIGRSAKWTIEEITLAHPITVPETGLRRIRIAGLVRDADEVEVAIRSDSTAYSLDHVRLRCRRYEGPEGLVTPPVTDCGAVGIDDRFYTDLMFQGPRFQAVRAYRKLTSTECIAELEISHSMSWFDHRLPSELMLSAPSIRDAAIHAIQACIPNQRVLPVAVSRIRILGPMDSKRCIVRAREIDHTGDFLSYDVEIFTSEGTLCEEWVGLKLKVIGPIGRAEWSDLLLGPQLERVFSPLFSEHKLQIAVEHSTGNREERAKRVPRTFEGFQRPLYRRADGKLIVPGDCGYSVSHAKGLTIAVAASSLVGLDVEIVEDRPVSLWRDLLGSELWSLCELASIQGNEDRDSSATRVWAVQESLKKLGKVVPAPLQLVQTLRGGVVTFRSGTVLVSTYVCRILKVKRPIVVALGLAEAPCPRKREEKPLGTAAQSNLSSHRFL